MILARIVVKPKSSTNAGLSFMRQIRTEMQERFMEVDGLARPRCIGMEALVFAASFKRISSTEHHQIVWEEKMRNWWRPSHYADTMNAIL